MREEKKKNEKREKKEKEEEDARLAPWMSHIKYAVGIKQRVAAALSKVRGEEYRAHGQNGWLWLSSTRNFRYVKTTHFRTRQKVLQNNRGPILSML